MNMIKWTIVLAGVASAAASTGCCCQKCGSYPAWMGGGSAYPPAPAYPPGPVTYPGPATYSVPPGGTMPGPVTGAPTNQYPSSQVPNAQTNYK
jgi:hypothetical protein